MMSLKRCDFDLDDEVDEEEDLEFPEYSDYIVVMGLFLPKTRKKFLFWLLTSVIYDTHDTWDAL